MSFNDLYRATLPCTCFVACSSPSGSASVGSGTLVHQSLVLTNAHVVLQSNMRQSFSTIQVYAPRAVTGTPRFGTSARLLFVDTALDLAFLALSSPMPSTMTTATLASQEAVEGDQVFCIGYPEALDESSFSLGYVRSRVCGTIRGLSDMVTTIPSFPGNSGSGIFSVRPGTREPILAGILTYTMISGEETLTSGLSLSKLKPAVEYALRRLSTYSSMFRQAAISQGPFGCLPRYNLAVSVGLVDPFLFRSRKLDTTIPALLQTENTVGYIVKSVVANTAAARANIQPGDILLGFLNSGYTRQSSLNATSVTLFTEENTIGDIVYPSLSSPATKTVNFVVNKFGTNTAIVVSASMTLISETFPVLGSWATLGLSLIAVTKLPSDKEGERSQSPVDSVAVV